MVIFLQETENCRFLERLYLTRRELLKILAADMESKEEDTQGNNRTGNTNEDPTT